MKIERFAVIGHPIGHTMSPFIHKKLFELSGYNPEYSVLDIADVKASAEELGKYDGLNITIPHKAAIIEILNSTDKKAGAFGSCNTVKNEGGILKGYTTDGAGCVMALESRGVYLSGDVLLLGNGGAARAVGFEAALSKELCSLTIALRASSKEKGEKLKADVTALTGFDNIIIKDYESLSAENTEYDLLINTTSVGMYPNTKASPVGEDVVSRCKAVFDAVYNPGMTKLLSMAEKMGKMIIPGIDMLVYQAVKAHEIWYGAEFKREDISFLCEKAAEETAKLFGGDKA